MEIPHVVFQIEHFAILLYFMFMVAILDSKMAANFEKIRLIKFKHVL